MRFQFLLGTLITLRALGVFAINILVSIPLRYADNRHAVPPDGAAAPEFQFLLGTLITRSAEAEKGKEV